MDSSASFSAQGIVPTAEQLAIQTSSDDTLIVHANAGAAKTTSLALRIAEGLARGLAPSSILALTYTEPACDALRAALRKIGVAPDVVKKVWISSFETFALYCLKSAEGAALSYLRDPEALEKTVWAAVEELRERAEPELLQQLWLPHAGHSEFVELFLRQSLRAKGMLAREMAHWDERRITPEYAEECGLDFTLLCVLAEYEKLRHPPGADTPKFRAEHDASYDLARLVGDPDQPEFWNDIPKWPRHLNALMLDEMHDLNHALFVLTRALLLTNPKCYFCGVGDADQVIHANAGADASFMQAATFEPATGRSITPLTLTASYRFGPALAAYAGSLARKPYAAQAAHASSVHSLGYADDVDCVQQIVQAALQWRAAKQKMNSLVVLLRHPHQSVLLENALVQAQLPYATRGFGTYLQRPEVMLVRALLAVATGQFGAVQSLDTRRRMVEELVGFCRVELGFGDDEKTTQAQRVHEAVQHVAREPATLAMFFDGQILRNAEPAIVRRLRAAMAIAGGPHSADMFARMLDALEIRGWAATHWVEKQRRAQAVAHFDGLKLAAASFGSAVDFFAHLNRTELALEAQHARNSRAAQTSELLLADIASVKGLEFEHVVLPFLAQGVFPSSERLAMADERNLAYVAMTRARSVLTLLVSSAAPSQFVAEMQTVVLR
ncbi:UvrD-helicase domain-containing protein [Rhodoferax sp.]|uniref:UvrD-helicase domain-containing protein n=1 Tax=Rhodoferax sp. TaxID=50421 RepID=UPI00374CD28A